MSIKRTVNIISTKIDRLGDRFNKEELRCDSKNLVLLDDNGPKVAVVYDKETMRWIECQFEYRMKKTTDSKFAVGVDGKIYILDFDGEKLTYNNHEVNSMFSHSPNSQLLPWVIKKYSSLNGYNKDDKLTLSDLKNIQKNLDEEKCEKSKQVEEELCM